MARRLRLRSGHRRRRGEGEREGGSSGRASKRSGASNLPHKARNLIVDGRLGREEEEEERRNEAKAAGGGNHLGEVCTAREKKKKKTSLSLSVSLSLPPSLLQLRS